jgi:large subunit ribosomal protein L20
MTRIKRGKTHLKRRKNILRYAKGHHLGRKNLLRLAKTHTVKAGVNAYRDRRRKKREKRTLWQIKINAGVREHGLTYSRFMHLLKEKNILLDRKVLAEIAEFQPKTFGEIVERLK